MLNRDQLRQRVAELEAHVERLRGAMTEASSEHIGFAKRIMQGADSTAMAAVDKADALLVRESCYIPVDTTILARRDLIKQAEALERATQIYTHEWKDEFSGVVTDIISKGLGYIHPEGLLGYADQLRQQAEALK